MTANVQMARRGVSDSACKDAEMLGCLVVLAHRIGHASAGVHAAERGADQRQEHGDRLGQHEVLAMALAQQSVADNDHHVADRRRGSCRALHRVPRVQEVVCGKILESDSRPVPESAAMRLRQLEYALVGFFASPPIAVTDSKPTRIRIATVA